MASDPELNHALQQLDHELEEGDITKKGYEKRRTLLFSQYLPPEEPQPVHRGLRIHSIEDSDHPAANKSLSGVSRPLHLVKSEGNYPSGSLHSRNSSLDHHLGQTQRPYDREPSGLQPPQRQSSQASYDSLFLPKQKSSAIGPSPDTSRSETLVSQNYAFNPDHQAYPAGGSGGNTRQSTMLDSQQQYFSDFAGQQLDDGEDPYNRGQRHSQMDMFSPSAQIAPPLLSAGELPGGDNTLHMLPLEPREIPFNVCDPHDQHVEMGKFDNLAMVLRHRAKTIGKQPAYWVLDSRGREIVSITWEKLASRAEKVGSLIKEKSSLYVGDRVALIYRDTEVIEFAIAMMGCFIAGVVAVPINDLRDYRRLEVILKTSQAHLALTTEANLKNFQRDITAAKLQWPRGVEWWKTNEFGVHSGKKKGDDKKVEVPDLAYIEFSTAPTGDLRGVVLSHRTIMHQMSCLSAIVSTAPLGNGEPFNKQGRPKAAWNRLETILSFLDPREGIGMILAVLLNVYGGHTAIWFEAPGVETPGMYAHLITKYRATLLVADYPRLKRAVYNYQSDPMATRNFKKGVEPNFSAVRLCLIDTLTVDTDFHGLLADRWLRPLHNPRAREVVAPMLCLPEHGGMVVSVRDWLGGEEQMGCSLIHDMDKKVDKSKDLGETTKLKNSYGSSLIGGVTARPIKRDTPTDLAAVLLDKEALKTNEIVVIAMGDEAREKSSHYPNTITCGAFGHPFPDATLAVVDPETCLLCRPNTIGEIWVDSPSLSGGFWGLPKFTQNIFHARPYMFKEGSPTPVSIEPEFLRTGLLGTVIEGKIFVLGLYEDRLRQRVEWVEHGLDTQEHRYFFVQHLIMSIMKNVPKIHDCSAFDCFVNDEHLPIVLLESPAASTAPLTSGGPPRQLDIPLLDSLSERCMEVLMEDHLLRVFCVMITAPNTLPRVTKSGRDEIGNMRCRKEFDNGALPCVHVKFGVERAVLNLPIGEDPVGGIWSFLSSASRQELLIMQDKQYSGVDPREVVLDERSKTPLNKFSNIVDLLQWRVTRQADELAYCTIDGRGREGKGVTWKKFDQRIAGVAMYLKNKVKIRSGDHVILMYTHSEDFVFAIFACLVLGAVAIPVAPLDPNRLAEDAPAFLHIVADLSVRCVIVNADVDGLLKQKLVSQHLKQSANWLKINVPGVYSTAKPSKQSHGCRELGLKMSPSWLGSNVAAIVWTYWTPDQRRMSVQLGHDTILGMCKVQKETCQMSSSRPLLGCVRSTVGLGFLHTCLMGVYIGAPTYLVSPVDFAQNPSCVFSTLSKHRIKDTYATNQMLEFAINSMPAKGFSLQELRNLMLPAESRPQSDIYNKVRVHFGPAGLDSNAIDTVYSHILNPMVASRSYMSTPPVEIYLDTRALRRGLIYPVNLENDPLALLVQDSGMVPVATQIAIVNPETCQLCSLGEYGEIWVQSEACAKAFYMSKQEFDLERFQGRVAGGDPTSTFVRMGDLGFLYNVTRPIGPGGEQVEMQVLFNLGSIGETFEINGLNHFAMDIENSVERCHRNIPPSGSAIFQAGGLVVVVVEVYRKAYLASMVPVIVNAILNEHQVVVDLIAFVSNGDFPRSRLGEKQRGKILASWVTRKLRTIAQFGIRDPQDPENQIIEVPEPRTRATRTSINSKGVNTRADPARSSIVSDSAAHIAPHPHHNTIIEDYHVDSPAQMTPHSARPEAHQQSHIEEENTHAHAPRTSSITPQQSRIDGEHTHAPRTSSIAPMVALNDKPYTIPEGPHELPSQAQDSHAELEAETSQNSNSYDPNADPYDLYGGDVLHELPGEEVSALPDFRLPRLSTGPVTELPSFAEEPTPTTASASDSTSPYPGHPDFGKSQPPQPESAPLSVRNASTKDFDSPYGESGNPYTDYYNNANIAQTAPMKKDPGPDVESANLPTPKPTFSSPPPLSQPFQAASPPPPLPTAPVGRGRATLPSQQVKSRYSSYGTMPGLGGLFIANPSNPISPPATAAPPTQQQQPPAPKRVSSQEKVDSIPQEALLYASQPWMQDSDEALHKTTSTTTTTTTSTSTSTQPAAQPATQTNNDKLSVSKAGNVNSVSGSVVRRRYDGSEYDDGW